MLTQNEHSLIGFVPLLTFVPPDPLLGIITCSTRGREQVV